MAESLRPWICKSLIQHDRENGAQLEKSIPLEGLVQIKQFLTYRTPPNPHAQIIGVVGDRTNWIRVAFDVKATDIAETSTAGEQTETLTSHLRAIIRIKKAFFRLTQRPVPRAPNKQAAGEGRTFSLSTSTASIVSDEIPIVWMDVLEWEVITGDKNEPEFWPDTVEVGLGGIQVGEVQKVLRKWWAGESDSGPSQSQNLSPDKTFAGPSTISPPKNPDNMKSSSRTHVGKSTSKSISRSTSLKPTEQQGRVTLSAFLESYLGENKKKTIPEWIFEIPQGVGEELAEIKVFGVDFASNLPSTDDDPIVASEIIPPLPQQEVIQEQEEDDEVPVLTESDQQFLEVVIPPRSTPTGLTNGLEATDSLKPMSHLAEPQSMDEFGQPPAESTGIQEIISAKGKVQGKHTESTVLVKKSPADINIEDPPDVAESESDNDDEEMEIRPAHSRKRKVRDDPLAFDLASSQGSSIETSDQEGRAVSEEQLKHEQVLEEEQVQKEEEEEEDGRKDDQVEGETDEEDLSDYERLSRRQSKIKPPSSVPPSFNLGTQFPTLGTPSYQAGETISLPIPGQRVRESQDEDEDDEDNDDEEQEAEEEEEEEEEEYQSAPISQPLLSTQAAPESKLEENGGVKDDPDQSQSLSASIPSAEGMSLSKYANLIASATSSGETAANPVTVPPAGQIPVDSESPNLLDIVVNSPVSTSSSNRKRLLSQPVEETSDQADEEDEDMDALNDNEENVHLAKTLHSDNGKTRQPRQTSPTAPMISSKTFPPRSIKPSVHPERISQPKRAPLEDPSNSTVMKDSPKAHMENRSIAPPSHLSSESRPVRTSHIPSSIKAENITPISISQRDRRTSDMGSIIDQPVIKKRKIAKLGGFKPDLVISDGMSKEWLKEVVGVVRASRAKKSL